MCTLLRIKLPKKCVYVANEAADSHSMWNNIFELACQHGLISHFFNAFFQPNAAVFCHSIHLLCLFLFLIRMRKNYKKTRAHTQTESPESTTFINVWIDWNNSNCGAHNKWYKICYNLFDLCFMAFSYPKYTYCMHCITAQRCKTGPNTERPKKEHSNSVACMKWKLRSVKMYFVGFLFGWHIMYLLFNACTSLREHARVHRVLCRAVPATSNDANLRVQGRLSVQFRKRSTLLPSTTEEINLMAFSLLSTISIHYATFFSPFFSPNFFVFTIFFPGVNFFFVVVLFMYIASCFKS